jgi:predicted RNA-binding Zn-ribbon protein involved in translation (DUF1610 family)
MTEIVEKENCDKTLEFTCPGCGGHTVAERLVNYENIWMYEDGDWEVGDEYWESDKVEFSCWDCNRSVVDDHGRPIRCHETLVRWIKGQDTDTSTEANADEDRESVLDEDSDHTDLEAGMLLFVCPKCGGKRLDAVTFTMTPLFFDEHERMQFGKAYHDEDKAHFRCRGCKWIIEDEQGRVGDYEVLGSWLEKNSYRSDDEQN